MFALPAEILMTKVHYNHNSLIMKTIIRIIIFHLFLPVFVPAQGVWTQKANYLGAPRYYFIGYALSNKGYMGTGTYGGVYSYLADWQEFDPVQNTWTQKAPLPAPFRFGAGFTAGNFGYATGGVNEATYIYDTYEYNQAGNNWSSKATFVNTRIDATGIGSGDFGYIVGGYDVMAAPMNDCWEYNQPSNTWTQRADLPVSAARYYATGFAINGNIYIFGGTDGMNLLNDLWEFNPANNTWTQKTSLPAEGRQMAMAFVINNTAYLVGGFPSTTGTLKDFWKYDPVTNQWTQLPDFPGTTGPAGGVGFSINGSGYVVCGNGTSETWEYTPETYSLAVSPSNQNVSAAAGSTTFTVTSNSAWTASSNATWCTVTSSGNGNGTINANYTSNPENTVRVAQITVSVSGVTPVLVTVTQDIYTGIGQMSSDDLLITPNPNNGLFIIKSKEHFGEKLVIDIFNSVGNLVRKSDCEAGNDCVFDMQNSAKGVYFVRIGSNRKTIIRKIIIQ
jgi:N-acetylneuraminic acid mutarotase